MKYTCTFVSETGEKQITYLDHNQYTQLLADTYDNGDNMDSYTVEKTLYRDRNVAGSLPLIVFELLNATANAPLKELKDDELSCIVLNYIDYSTLDIGVIRLFIDMIRSHPLKSEGASITDTIHKMKYPYTDRTCKSGNKDELRDALLELSFVAPERNAYKMLSGNALSHMLTLVKESESKHK